MMCKWQTYSFANLIQHIVLQMHFIDFLKIIHMIGCLIFDLYLKDQTHLLSYRNQTHLAAKKSKNLIEIFYIKKTLFMIYISS